MEKLLRLGLHRGKGCWKNVIKVGVTMESQLKWVLANGPWSFEDHPLALRRWKRGMTTTLVRFTSMPMWDQVWALPFEGKDVGRVFP